MAKLRGDFVVLQREEYRRLLAFADAAHGALLATRSANLSDVPSNSERIATASSRWKGGAAHV